MRTFGVGEVRGEPRRVDQQLGPRVARLSDGGQRQHQQHAARQKQDGSHPRIVGHRGFAAVQDTSLREVQDSLRLQDTRFALQDTDSLADAGESQRATCTTRRFPSRDPEAVDSATSKLALWNT